MDPLESSQIRPTRPEGIFPVISQAAAVAAVASLKTRKPSSLTMNWKSRSSTNSRQPVTQDVKFMCTVPGCNFTTKYEFNLKCHTERHDDGNANEPSRRSKSRKFTPRKNRSLSKPASEIFQCNQCSYSTAYKGNMKRHVANHPNYQPFATDSNDPTFGCQYCEYRSRWKANVKVHEKRKHSAIPRKIWGQNKMAKVRVMNNMKTKKGEQSKCQMDLLTSATNVGLPREGRFHCRDCDYTSNNKSHFVSHIMKRHSEEEQDFICSFPGCGFRSKWSQWTIAHERRTHSFTRSQPKTQMKTARASKKLKSTNADFVKGPQRPPSKKITISSSSANLTPTDEIPAGQVKVKCPKCEVKCYPRSLWRHLMVHSNEKPFMCSVDGCNYRTKWPNALQKHMTRHEKISKKSTTVLESSSCRPGNGGNKGTAGSGIPQLPFPESGCNFKIRDGRDLGKHKIKCHAVAPVPRVSSRPTRKLNSGKGCRLCDCTKKSDVGKHGKGHSCKEPTVVDQPEVDKEPSLVNHDDEENKENCKEASTEPVEPAVSTEFACTLCDFVGYSEEAAWEHAKCHRQSILPNDKLQEIPLICLD